MKNTIVFLTIILTLFSCEHRTEIKKKRSGIIKDSVLKKEIFLKKEKDTIIQNLIPPKLDDYDIKINLPNNRYAVITFESYFNEKREFEWLMWLYKPKTVRVYDCRTKKRVPETKLNGYYPDKDDKNFDDTIYYGDFNFDGKMDVAIRGEESRFHNFYYWNFFLATSKGYKFSKSFSKIMDYPISYFMLDAKNKKISAVAEVEYDETFEYKVQNNKAKLVKDTRFSHSPMEPFYNRYIELWNGKKMIYKYDDFLKDYIKDKDYKYAVLSFEIKKLKKRIKIFIYGNDSQELYYTVLKNKDNVVEFSYSRLFNYTIKNNVLVFEDKNITYKVYETKEAIGVEMLENGKTIKLIGDVKSKKGNLSQLLIMKKEIEKDGFKNVENIVIE